MVGKSNYPEPPDNSLILPRFITYFAFGGLPKASIKPLFAKALIWFFAIFSVIPRPISISATFASSNSKKTCSTFFARDGSSWLERKWSR